MTRIGPDQLQTLIMLASPMCTMLTADRSSRALVKRGLLRLERKGYEASVITPAGLRALADEMEAGRVKLALETMKKETAERRAKIEAKRGKNK
jgi:hypothetical protein